MDILRRSRDLALFDELGAVTDPTEGQRSAGADHPAKPAANVQHYGHHALQRAESLCADHHGRGNASVEFDLATLRPTYRPSIGIPGKSNAFEISRKLGLSGTIIDGAKQLLRKTTCALRM